MAEQLRNMRAGASGAMSLSNGAGAGTRGSPAAAFAVAALVSAAAEGLFGGRAFDLAEFSALHAVLGHLGHEFHSLAHAHVDRELHHVARLHELFAQTAHILRVGAAAARNSPAARSVDDRGILPLLGRHR